MKKSRSHGEVVDIDFGQEDCDDPEVYRRVEEEREVNGENPFKGQRGEAAWRAFELARHHGVDAVPPGEDFREETIIVQREGGPCEVARGGFHKFNSKLDEEQREPHSTPPALLRALSGMWERRYLLWGTGAPPSGVGWEGRNNS
jgi:hypothetical protein